MAVVHCWLGMCGLDLLEVRDTRIKLGLEDDGRWRFNLELMIE